MARASGVALKTVQLFLRAIELCCAALVLSLFSYFLAKLSIAHLPISNYAKSIEGISGIAVVYTALSILLVCCLGGLKFFAFLGFILDICFMAGFVYIAFETRTGVSSCMSGYVDTPLGSGDVTKNDNSLYALNADANLPSLSQSCRMETANFAVSIVAIVFFLLSAIVEIALWRHHKSEKKYGPSPANNYTTGSGNRKFWQRRQADPTLAAGGLGGAEKYGNENSLPTHSTPADVRQSYATDTTAVGTDHVGYSKYGHAGGPAAGGYAAPAQPLSTHAHGYTAPRVSNELSATRY